MDGKRAVGIGAMVFGVLVFSGAFAGCKRSSGSANDQGPKLVGCNTVRYAGQPLTIEACDPGVATVDIHLDGQPFRAVCAGGCIASLAPLDPLSGLDADPVPPYEAGCSFYRSATSHVRDVTTNNAAELQGTTFAANDVNHMAAHFDRKIVPARFVRPVADISIGDVYVSRSQTGNPETSLLIASVRNLGTDYRCFVESAPIRWLAASDEELISMSGMPPRNNVFVVGSMGGFSLRPDAYVTACLGAGEVGYFLDFRVSDGQSSLFDRVATIELGPISWLPGIEATSRVFPVDYDIGYCAGNQTALRISAENRLTSLAKHAQIGPAGYAILFDPSGAPTEWTFINDALGHDSIEGSQRASFYVEPLVHAPTSALRVFMNYSSMGSLIDLDASVPPDAGGSADGAQDVAPDAVVPADAAPDAHAGDAPPDRTGATDAVSGERMRTDGDACDPVDPPIYASSPRVVYSCGMCDPNFDPVCLKTPYQWDATSWNFSVGAAGLMVSPTSSNFPPLTGALTTCPDGSFQVQRKVTGRCCGTFTLRGTFTGPDSWTGMFSAEFCEDPMCGCTAGDYFSCEDGGCMSHTWAVSGTR